MLLVFVAAVVIAALCIECVRNKNYEDGIVGRAALWVLFLCAMARVVQIVDAAMAPYIGAGAMMARGIGLDNVETLLWLSLMAFLGRHYYRFRRALTDESYAWRPSVK